MPPKNSNAQQKRRMTHTYKYSTLKCLKEHCEKNPGPNGYNKNNYAVVVSVIEDERRAKGSDYFCIFMVQDPSCKDSEWTKVRFFAQDKSLLPKQITGNIVRIHRAKPQLFGDDLVLVINKYGSLVNWPANELSTFDDFKLKGNSTSETYNFIEDDFEQIKILKEWLLNYPIVNHVIELPVLYSVLSKLQPNVYFNLVCQYVGIKAISDCHCVIKVVDGTKVLLHLTRTDDIPYEPIDSCNNSEDIQKNYIADLHIYGDHVEDFKKSEFNLGTIIQFNTLVVWENPATKSPVDIPTRALRKRKFDANKTVMRMELAMLPGLNKMFKLAEGLEMQQCKQKIETLLGKEICPSPSSSAGSSFHTCRSGSLTRNTASENSSCSFSSESTITQDSDLQYHDSMVIIPPDSLQLEECSEPPDSQNADLHSDEVNETIKSTGNADVILQPNADLENNVEKTTTQLVRSNTQNSVSQQSTPSEGALLSGRCQMESYTVLIDEELDSKQSTIQQMIKSEEGGVFKLFAQVKKQNDQQINGIYHCCPCSMLRVAGDNDGEPLYINEQCRVYVNAWRKAGGYDRPLNTSLLPVPDAGTQMLLPDSQGATFTTLDSYNSPDGGKWLRSATENYVYHKLTQDHDRFHILYILDIPGTKNSVEEMVKKSSKYNRVIRELSVDEMTSDKLPVVAVQNGVFYYSSPLLAREAKVPTLEEEALHFTKLRPCVAMGNPVMALNFITELSISYHTESVDVLLHNKAAKDFFCVTPEECLRDESDYIEDVIKKLSSGEVNFGMDCMVKKIIRKSMKNGEKTATYDLINTKFIFTV